MCFFFFQAEDGIRDADVTGVQTCALPISQLRLSASSNAMASDRAIAPATAPATAPVFLSPNDSRTPTRTASARAYFQAARAAALTVVRNRRSSKSLTAIAVISSIKTDRAVYRLSPFAILASVYAITERPCAHSGLAIPTTRP